MLFLQSSNTYLWSDPHQPRIHSTQMAPSPIRRIGVYLQADEHGFLPGPTAGQQIKEPWVGAVEKLTRHYRREWGPDLLSVYVRGSVARGLAIPGVSDIDSFGVLAAEAGGANPQKLREWSDAVNAEMRQAFPHVAGVEVDLVPFEVILDRQNYYSFVMKTEGVCVHGENLAGLVQPFRLSEANFQTRFFREHPIVFIEEYPDEFAAERPDFVAWIAKRFLRLGMELVMEKSSGTPGIFISAAKASPGTTQRKPGPYSGHSSLPSVPWQTTMSKHSCSSSATGLRVRRAGNWAGAETRASFIKVAEQLYCDGSRTARVFSCWRNGRPPVPPSRRSPPQLRLRPRKEQFLLSDDHDGSNDQQNHRLNQF